jgi:stage V sporulation protein AD
MRESKQTFIFNKQPKIISNYTIVGKKEGDGNLGSFFDLVLDDDLFEEKSYEIAESKMQKVATENALKKLGKNADDIDLYIAGDLLNQIFASSFSARELHIPYLGLYGACSTFGEGLLTASIMMNSGLIEEVCVVTSSHFSAAERQYRFPLELGNQRTPTSQWTVTGAGCSILSVREDVKNDAPKIVAATVGKVVDYGITDANNMGAAMAPAAAETVLAHLNNTSTSPEDYDLIMTGDLGKHGKESFMYLMEKNGVKVGEHYNDCGVMIYSADQATFQGGSGAGCSNVVFNSFLYSNLIQKKINRLLFVPTGALLSKDSPLQGESIPCIAHAISVEA